MNIRVMTKRPSAITMLGENSILCADKFGDVFSLPLISTQEEDEIAAKEVISASIPKTYTPAATELTVHSLKNRKILEIQQRMAKENAPIKPKEQMLFAHKLLLGHISMTTAILAPELSSEQGRTKQYI